jgi:hypothetical protein
MYCAPHSAILLGTDLARFLYSIDPLHSMCIAPGSERRAVRSIADAGDRLVTVNSALPKASALDPQPVLGRVGDVSGRLYGILMIA